MFIIHAHKDDEFNSNEDLLPMHTLPLSNTVNLNFLTKNQGIKIRSKID